jgi:hypothetical protein
MKSRTIFYFCFFSFLTFGVWEWIQTPFYRDITSDLNTIVSLRVNSTFGDVLILLVAAAVWSFINWNTRWIARPGKVDIILISVMGLFYTFLSEYINVYVSGRWGYSDWMPLVPLTGIGVIPLLQWVLIPPIVIALTRDHLNGIGID